jgi:hypothetical protein
VCRQVARWTVRRFDAFVRRVKGVFEFTQDQGCMLRLGRERCRHAVHLADGTILSPGDPLLEIHLWNERIPPMPPDQPDVAWSVRFVRRWVYSLKLVAEYWRSDPTLAQVQALHGVFALPSDEQQIWHERTMRTLGFEVVRPEWTLWRRFSDFWQNVYNWAILWTYNPASLRVRRLRHMERCGLWMSRARLMEKVGAKGETQVKGGL